MKLKDKKIEILAVQSVVNENGYSIETLEPICPPVWAYFRHLWQGVPRRHRRTDAGRSSVYDQLAE